MSFLRISNGVTSISLGRSLSLSVVPFLILFALYAVTSYSRHKENPDDRVAPTFTMMKAGFVSSLIDPDRLGQYAIDQSIRLPEFLLNPQTKTSFDSRGLKFDVESGNVKVQFGGIIITDTIATGKRFLVSLAIILLGVLWGLHMGLFQDIEAFSYRFLVFFDKIPAPVLLPLLFIAFGMEDSFKVALVVAGVLPSIAIDTYLKARAIPNEQMIKGFTLGASDVEIAYRIVLPQIFPKILDTIRLNFKSIAILLIFGEMVSADAGLGYRILVLRRFMAMDIIIPYSIVLSILLFSVDWAVTFWIKRRYPWLNKE